MTTRHNLLTDSSFRTLVPWVPVNGSRLSKHTPDAVQGDSSLRVRLTADTNAGVRSSLHIPVTPSDSYAASAYVSVPAAPTSAGPATVSVQMIWFTDDDDEISVSMSTGRLIQVYDGWERISVVARAPSTAAYVQFQVVNISEASEEHYFALDAVLLEQSTFVGGWVDNTSSDDKIAVLNKALSQPTAHPVEGLPLRADVLIDDLVLNTIDEDDTLWVCTGIDGWWGHSAPEFPSIPRGTDDGDFDMSGRYEPRIITIKGTFFPKDASMLQRARDRLIGATNLVRRGAWFRTNENPTKAAFVRLNNKPLVDTVNARGKTEFSISFKAADPIRYGWNDNDSDGFATASIPAGSITSTVVTNHGTAAVSGTFDLYGPLGAGATITNTRTGETLRLTAPLRGAGLVASIESAVVLNGVATLSLSAAPQLYAGDQIVVSGLGAPYDSTDTPHVVTSVVGNIDQPPFFVSYAVKSPDLPFTSGAVNGTIRLAYQDVLSINTYDKSVTFNGVSIGNRSRVDTLVDWIQLMPGDNELVMYDPRTQFPITSRSWASDRTGVITTEEPHFLRVNDQVTINIPETVPLDTKQLTSNTVTLTTDYPHGFVAGDRIDVETTEKVDVVSKSVAANVVTLTTLEAGEFNTGDSITVSLPSSARIVSKESSGTEVTLTASTPHGFSNGDSITVSLPTSATAVLKARDNNTAVLTTSGAHYFSVGDRINIVMPFAATVIQKDISSSTVTLTTAAAHGWAVGDTVTLTMPTSATPTGARSMSGGSALTATINTTTAHGFDAGDRITVGLGVIDTRTISSRSATTTRVTVVCGTHNFAVGEMIQITGMGSRYDGQHAIAAVTSTTVSYDFAGSSAASASAPSGSTITNLSIRDGYNGEKIIESVTSTTITYFAGVTAQNASSGSGGSGHTLTNETNADVTGTKTLTAVGSSTRLSYARGA